MGSKGTKVTVYFSCIGKGQVLMPVSLKQLQHQMKQSKVADIHPVKTAPAANPPIHVSQVKVYHPSSLEMEVYSKKRSEEVLEELECPVERMQVRRQGRWDPRRPRRRPPAPTCPSPTAGGTSPCSTSTTPTGC